MDKTIKVPADYDSLVSYVRKQPKFRQAYADELRALAALDNAISETRAWGYDGYRPDAESALTAVTRWELERALRDHYEFVRKRTHMIAVQLVLELANNGVTQAETSQVQ